jgi:hypothetical protein
LQKLDKKFLALYKFFEKSESFLKKFSQKFKKNVKNYFSKSKK